MTVGDALKKVSGLLAAAEKAARARSAVVIAVIEHNLKDAEHAAGAAIHFVEKEISMPFSPAFQDALNRIEAAFSSGSDRSAADASTISNLQSKVSDLTAMNTNKDGAIADLTQKLSDATQQISDMEAATIAAANQIAPLQAAA